MSYYIILLKHAQEHGDKILLATTTFIVSELWGPAFIPSLLLMSIFNWILHTVLSVVSGITVFYGIHLFKKWLNIKDDR